jgi:hypothetical protein
LAAKTITEVKNTTTESVTAATYGISGRNRGAESHCARVAKSDRTRAQNSSEPFCPAQKAETMK